MFHIFTILSVYDKMSNEVKPRKEDIFMNNLRINRIIQAALCFVLSGIIVMSPLMVQAEGNHTLPSGADVYTVHEQLKEMIDSKLHENTVTLTGGAVRLSVEDEMIYAENFGYANLADGINVTDETVFEWGTVSYILVWISVLQLCEDGKLDPDADITMYLPESELKDDLSSGDMVTMNHLMNYASGYSDSFSEKMISEGFAYPELGEYLETNMPKQAYAPGNVVAASDWSTGLAAYIVECVSGMSYADYVKTNIFEPLGMEHTALLPDLSDNEWVMNARKEVKSYSMNMEIANHFYHVPLYPSGMVTGTINDLHILANELLVQDENSRLFDKKETAETLFDATWYYTGTEDARLAHGMFIYELGKPVYGFYGVSATQTALLYMEPENKICLTYMTNEYNETSFGKELSEAVFGTPDYTKEEKLNGLRVYEGVYVPGSSPVSGKATFSGFMSSMFLTLNDEQQLVMPMLGKMEMFDILDDSHIMLTNGNMGRMYAYADTTTVLMMPATDYVSYSAFTYFAQLISLLLMLVGYFYASIVVLLAIFGFVMRRINKSKLEESKFRKYHYIQCLNMTLFSLVFAFMVIMLMASSPLNSINSTGVMYWLGSVMSLIYLLFFWKSGRNEKVAKKTKIAYWTTAVFSVVTVVFAMLFGLIL